MEQADRLDLAIQQVQEAVERVRAAWQSQHPDLPVPEPEPSPAAWYPDPHQAPVTTRQWAERTRMRANALSVAILVPPRRDRTIPGRR